MEILPSLDSQSARSTTFCNLGMLFIALPSIMDWRQVTVSVQGHLTCVEARPLQPDMKLLV